MGDIAPSQTVYINNLYEKLKKEGAWARQQVQHVEGPAGAGAGPTGRVGAGVELRSGTRHSRRRQSGRARTVGPPTPTLHRSFLTLVCLTLAFALLPHTQRPRSCCTGSSASSARSWMSCA